MPNGSIGNLAQQVLDEVKANNLVKLAEHQILQNVSGQQPATTEIGQLLQKVAGLLRSKSSNVTVGDVGDFLEELNHAD